MASASPETSTLRVRFPEAQNSDADSAEVIHSLLEQMRNRWSAGQQLRVEDMLGNFPELDDRSDLVFHLLTEEICLRREHGDPPSASELIARFPQWEHQLDILLECQQLFEDEANLFPSVGETIGEFQLQTELGRGSLSRVFLARQLSLCERPVVVKIVPQQTYEHLRLARLQHTFIVPLYSTYTDAAEGRMVLCMPYFGSKSLGNLLDGLRRVPPAGRTGKHLLAELDHEELRVPTLLGKGPSRKFLSRISYTSAICWMGVCLAEALQYAHERNLIHLDVKPSNVLVTAEGQPMLLDFHLAQEPMGPGKVTSPWLGGTPPYMSPEQRRALEDVAKGQSLSVRVDARADVYSLGATLCEALGAEPPDDGRWSIPRQEISAGLADILERCLAERPEDRYPSAAALTEDLRRHLNDLPLVGVANRSLPERLSKWNARHPVIARLLTSNLVFAILGIVAFFWLRSNEPLERATDSPTLRTPSTFRENSRRRQAREAYVMGRALMAESKYWLAKPFLQRAIQGDPQHFASQFHLGMCAYRMGESNDAVLAFTSCLALAPPQDRARCYVNRALAYVQMDDAESALRDYDLALHEDPRLSPALLNRGVLHYRAERYDFARQDLLEAHRLGRTDEGVLYNLALVSLAMGKTDEARTYLTKLLSHSPNHREGLQLELEFAQRRNSASVEP